METPENSIAHIYAEVQAFREAMPVDVPVRDNGFSILLAPPREGAVAFVGINPRRSDGAHARRYPEAMQRPPSEHLYLSARGGDMAAALERMVAAADLTAEVQAQVGAALRDTNALNMWFFGTANVTEWRADRVWGTGGAALRSETERMCAVWVSRALGALHPPVIVALGIAAYRNLRSELADHGGWTFGETERQPLVSSGGHALNSVCWCEATAPWGPVHVVGIPHPTGARGLSSANRAVLGAVVARAVRGIPLDRSFLDGVIGV